MDNRQNHIDRNYDYFKNKLDNGELDQFSGKFALLINEEIRDYFDSWDDAEKFGKSIAQYEKDVIFSIQKVTKQIADLGFYSLAFS